MNLPIHLIPTDQSVPVCRDYFMHYKLMSIIVEKNSKMIFLEPS